MIKLKKEDIVLDVGCWDGSKVIGLNKQKCVKLAMGVDINKKRLKSSPYLFCVDVTKELPFKRIFTKVLCTEVLEHLWGDDAALENIKKVLKPGGILFVSVPRNIPNLNWWDPAYLKWKLTRNKVYRHYHYSKKELVTKLQKHSFKIKKVNILYSYKWLFVRWLNCFLKYVLKSNQPIKYKSNKNNKGKFTICVLAKLEK